MKKVKKAIRKYFKWWVHWMGLGFWDITASMMPGKKLKKNGERLCGKTFVFWQYLSAYVYFYPENMKNMTEKQIEAVVIHELAHVLINEMRARGIDHEERVATGLQKAFSWVKGAK